MATAAHSLSAAQQQQLDDKKVQLRLSNEKYLRSKPEVRAITKAFMNRVLLEKPDDVLVFAHKFFCGEDLEAIARGAKGASL